MNRHTAIFAPVFLLALGSMALSTGCASTTTQASLGETVDDSVITTKVKAAFVEDKVVSALDIKVETYKGTVQLSGFANSMAEVQQAGYLAGKVKGVKSVKNDIALKTAH